MKIGKKVFVDKLKLRNPHLNKKDINNIYDDIMEIMTEELNNQNIINFPNLGTLQKVERKEKKIYIPSLKEYQNFPNRNSITFTVFQHAKKNINV